MEEINNSDKYFNNSKEEKLIRSFNKILKQFLLELNKSFPEYKINELKEYKTIEDLEDKYLLYFMNKIEPNIEKLSLQDETLFEIEDSFFLRDIEFSIIWKEKMSDNNKLAIWKFLQTLYLIGKPFINNKEDIQGVIEEFNEVKNFQDKELLENINNQNKYILNIIKNLNVKKESKEEPDMPDFIQNSKIGKLAKELSSELNLEDLGFSEPSEGEKPEDMFKNIIGQNPQKLIGLIQTVGEKIQNKLSESDIQQEDLLGEAQKMMSSLGGNEMISNIFKDPKMKDMFENMSKMFGSEVNSDDLQNMAEQFANTGNQKTQVNKDKLKNMKTKERLRRKLEKKKKNNNKTEDILE